MKNVNLCDLYYYFYKNNIKPIDSLMDNRLYLGSYFCENYFFKLSQTIKYFKSMNTKIVIVVPIFSDENLKKGLKEINFIIESLGKDLDYFVINDIGLLNYFLKEYPNINVCLGRLMLKKTRDIRYIEDNEFDDVILLNRIFPKQVIGIESDGIKVINPSKQITVFYHNTYHYISCTRYCFFASLHNKNKFRINSNCCLECNYLLFESRLGNSNATKTDLFYRLGKGVYFIDNKKINLEQNEETIEIPEVIKEVIFNEYLDTIK